MRRKKYNISRRCSNTAKPVFGRKWGHTVFWWSHLRGSVKTNSWVGL